MTFPCTRRKTAVRREPFLSAGGQIPKGQIAVRNAYSAPRRFLPDGPAPCTPANRHHPITPSPHHTLVPLAPRKWFPLSPPLTETKPWNEPNSRHGGWCCCDLGIQVALITSSSMPTSKRNTKVIEKSGNQVAEMVAAELRWIQFVRANRMNKDRW